MTHHRRILLHRHRSLIERARAMRPIAYVPFIETSGTTAYDVSGYGANVTMTGFTLGEPGFAGVGPAAGLDGLNDYGAMTGAALTGYAARFSGSVGTIVVAIRKSAWAGGSIRFFFRVLVDGNNFVRIIETATAGQIQYMYAAGATQKAVTKSSISSTSNILLGISWNKPADRMQAWYNGAQEGATQTALGTWAGTVTAVTIGAQDSAPSLVHSGVLGHWLSFDRELTASDHADLARGL